MSSSKPPISTVIVEDNPALLELLTRDAGRYRRYPRRGIGCQRSGCHRPDPQPPPARHRRPRTPRGNRTEGIERHPEHPTRLWFDPRGGFSNHSHPVVRSPLPGPRGEAFFDKSFQMDELLEFVLECPARRPETRRPGPRASPLACYRHPALSSDPRETICFFSQDVKGWRTTPLRVSANHFTDGPQCRCGPTSHRRSAGQLFSLGPLGAALAKPEWTTPSAFPR